MDASKPEKGVLNHYTVRAPGMADRVFSTGEEAVRYITEHKGYLKLFGKNGELMLTKGTPKTDA